MTEDKSVFHDEFSKYTSATGRWRDIGPGELLARWVTFVNECERGYPRDAEDYFNDLTARDSLERARVAAELQKFPEFGPYWAAVEAADSKFRPLLLPDGFPKISRDSWWARGVVKTAGKRLVEDLRRDYNVEIAEVE